MIGTAIGNYEVQRLVAEGGMGRVYLAVHPTIGRKAAVKVLTTQSDDPEIASRFITEARAVNAIRHPNIVEIFDSGVLDSGAPYLVMEFLEGAEPTCSASPTSSSAPSRTPSAASTP